MKTYNHCFVIGFAIGGSKHPQGKDLTPQQVREAILKRLGYADDIQLLDAIGSPINTWDNTKERKMQDMKTYNHAFDIAFAISGSKHPMGEDVSPQQFREAIIQRLASLDDNELLEAIGLPLDTYEEQNENPV